MEAGYMDFQQVRTDPDLQFLRADSRFEVSERGSMLAPLPRPLPGSCCI